MRSPRNLPVLTAATAAPVEHIAAIPQDYAHPGISLLQLFSIVWAYRIHAAVIFAIFVLGAAAYAKSLAKIYTSTATLMVTNEPRDPLAGGAMAVPANNIATEIQLMQSPEVLLPVVSRLKLTDNKEYSAGHVGDPRTLPDWIKDILYKDLDITPGAAGSQLIYVTASAGTPALAADIANSVSDVYLEQERERLSGPASERARRYSQELGELKDKVRIAQEQVTAFRQRTGVAVTAERNTVESDLLTGLETRLQEAQNLRRAAEVKAQADENLTAGASSNGPVQGLRNAITVEQGQLADLKATLGTQHPKVVALQSQIDANKQLLATEMQHYNSSTSADLAAARGLENKMRAAVDEQRTKVLAISRLQDEGTKYGLELESAQSVYKRALDGYDQIMFASGAHAANVDLVSRAVAPQKATKPNKVKFVFMGAMAGLFFGILGPLAFELLINRRVRCRDDFERDFGVPVLIEFNRIPNIVGSA